MKDKIRKTLRRWYRKLSVGLAAAAKIDETNKTIKVTAAAVAIAATTTAQANLFVPDKLYDGGSSTPPQWWTSVTNILTSREFWLDFVQNMGNAGSGRNPYENYNPTRGINEPDHGARPQQLPSKQK